MPPFLRFLLPACWSVYHLLLFSNARSMAKSFQVTRAPNGTELCATDPPATALNVSRLYELLVGIGTPSLVVLCGWKCTMDEGCTSYNWRDDIQVCELYRYDPTFCSVVACCSFYQVGLDEIVFGLLDGSFMRRSWSIHPERSEYLRVQCPYSSKTIFRIALQPSVLHLPRCLRFLLFVRLPNFVNGTLSPVNKLVSLAWLLWALRSFRSFTLHCIIKE